MLLNVFVGLLPISFLRKSLIISNNLYLKDLVHTVSYAKIPRSYFHSKKISKNNNNVEDQYAIEATRLWVHDFVHGYGLCPFAAGVLTGNKMLISVVKNDHIINRDQLLINLNSKIIENAISLKSSNITSTTILIVPQIKNFHEYLDFSELIENTLEELGLDEYIQMATFHPNYQFKDTNEEDAENWTNRSPFPMIHLLKVEEVSNSLLKYADDPDNIWKVNKQKMKNLGIDKLKAILKDILTKSDRKDS